MREIEVGASRLQLIYGDIVHLDRHVGAIVNSANEHLRPTRGVSGAIHTTGGPEIAVECRWIGRVETGKAAMTSAGKLDADAVIHAVGPIWQRGTMGEDKLLASAYRTSLELAEKRGLTSIAFPSISTGIFAFPVNRAAAIAVGTVAAYLKRGSKIQDVIFVLYSGDDYEVYIAALERWQQIEAARVGPAVFGAQRA